MKLLFTFLSFALLFSCTITKRHFGPGYHVEWKSSISSKKPNADLTTIDSTSKWIVETNNTEPVEIVGFGVDLPTAVKPEEHAVVEESDRTDLVDFNQEEVSNEEKTIATPKKDPDKNSQEKTQIEKSERVTEKSTWYSLGFLLLAAILTTVFAISGFLTTVGAGILIGAMAIGMFVSSLIAVIRIRNNPDRYKNKGLSFSLFFVSCTVLFLGLVLLLYTIISESNFGLNM